MVDIEMLTKLKALGVKEIGMHDSGVLHYVEFFQTTPQVQTSTMPMIDNMPPDDVMMFAATEDVEELMKQRKVE
jgi:hypothetical protein